MKRFWHLRPDIAAAAICEAVTSSTPCRAARVHGECCKGITVKSKKAIHFVPGPRRTRPCLASSIVIIIATIFCPLCHLATNRSACRGCTVCRRGSPACGVVAVHTRSRSKAAAGAASGLARPGIQRRGARQRTIVRFRVVRRQVRTRLAIRCRRHQASGVRSGRIGRDHEAGAIVAAVLASAPV